ncbi:MAG: fibronectin type III domain-containing protein, partial [Muribaculaceae bacterium]|nr:fibronectin type III domain-containing protein [Muribaculaceae bacterium]
RVYLYNSSTRKYEKYKDVSGTSCTVKNLSSGKTYKFKVAALEEVNGKYQAGNSSKAVSAKTVSV